MLKDKRHFMIFALVCGMPISVSASSYTVLNANAQHAIVVNSRAKVTELLTQLASQRDVSLNSQIAFIMARLADTPYLKKGGVGEGDWQPNAQTYQAGAVHVVQYPVYRLDGFDCQSFVQVGMALLYSRNLEQFEQTLLKIAYGAAGNPNGETVHFYNRNNFVEADFNPINQRNGYLDDVSATGDLAQYTQTTSTWISRQNWFAKHNSKDTVNVLHATDGAAMAQRFKQTYAHLNFPKFNAEKVTINYLPKEVLARQPEILQAIPTPAIVEIVRDPRQWYVGRAKIRAVIGTNLTISHLGFIYRQLFHAGDLIYRKITCAHTDANQRVCHVTPIYCEQKVCRELMFAHATDAHPSGYYWYQLNNGNYTCSPTLPATTVTYTACNRIERLPLVDYLTQSQHGWYMQDPSYLGINIEKLNPAS